jgi:hypothetical protein
VRKGCVTGISSTAYAQCRGVHACAPAGKWLLRCYAWCDSQQRKSDDHHTGTATTCPYQQPGPCLQVADVGGFLQGVEPRLGP